MNEENLNKTRGYRDHPHISNSDLRYLHSPQSFYAAKAGLIEQSPPADHQILGTAFEDILVNDGNLPDGYMVKPDMVFPSSPAQHKFVEMMLDGNDAVSAYKMSYVAKGKEDTIEKKALDLYDSLKDWITFQTTCKNKIVLDQTDVDKLQKMYLSTISYPLYNQLFNKDLIVKHRVQITDLQHWNISWKGELDFLIIDEHNEIVYIIDLKTTSSHIGTFHFDVVRYRYYRQLALYRLLARHKMCSIDEKYKHYVYATRILAVQTVEPHEAAMIVITNNVLQKGEEELEKAAKIVRHYQSTNYTSRHNASISGLQFDWEETRLFNGD